MMGFNRWASPGMNYMGMNGWNAVDYSGGWNPQVHDMMLQQNINRVFMQYDMNMSGQLEGQEFFYAYRDLCLSMGVCPPMNYQDVWGAVMSCDYNGNGRVNKMELYMLFKRIQGINSGMTFNVGWGGMGGGMMGPGMGMGMGGGMMGPGMGMGMGMGGMNPMNNGMGGMGMGGGWGGW